MMLVSYISDAFGIPLQSDQLFWVDDCRHFVYDASCYSCKKIVCIKIKYEPHILVAWSSKDVQVMSRFIFAGLAPP